MTHTTPDDDLIEDIRLALLHPNLMRGDLVEKLDRFKRRHDARVNGLKLVVDELEYDVSNGGLALDTARKALAYG